MQKREPGLTDAVLLSSVAVGAVGISGAVTGTMSMAEGFVFAALGVMAFSATRSPRVASTLTSVGSAELVCYAVVPLVWSIVDLYAAASQAQGQSALLARGCQLGLAAVFLGCSIAYLLKTRDDTPKDDRRRLPGSKD
ncbi:MAG: hypothetical protein ACI4B6_00090 [Atopobiaceae bacterium]